MLKDLSEHSEEPGLALEGCSNSCEREPDGHEIERGCAQFRASLWLSIAADLRRERASRAMKGQVSC